MFCLEITASSGRIPCEYYREQQFFCNIDKLETPNFSSAGRMAKLTMEYPVTEYYVILTWKVPQDVFWSGEQNANCRTICIQSFFDAKINPPNNAVLLWYKLVYVNELKELECTRN